MYFDPLDDVDELLKPSTRTVVIDVFKGTGHVGISLRNTECGEGVLVTHVHPRDLACQAGLRAGDIIRKTLALNASIPARSVRSSLLL